MLKLRQLKPQCTFILIVKVVKNVLSSEISLIVLSVASVYQTLVEPEMQVNSPLN